VQVVAFAQEDPLSEYALLRPFHVTVEPLVNPVPVTVKPTGLLLPALAADGLMPVMTGTGLIVNILELELTPSALHTVMAGVSTPASSAAVTVATRVVGLEYDEARVDTDAPEAVGAHFTTDPLVK
jgi:hypothetical protein